MLTQKNIKLIGIVLAIILGIVGIFSIGWFIADSPSQTFIETENTVKLPAYPEQLSQPGLLDQGNISVNYSLGQITEQTRVEVEYRSTHKVISALWVYILFVIASVFAVGLAVVFYFWHRTQQYFFQNDRSNYNNI